MKAFLGEFLESFSMSAAEEMNSEAKAEVDFL